MRNTKLAKKLVIGAMIALFVGVASGCANAQRFDMQACTGLIETRAQQNKDLMMELVTCGLLRKESYDKYAKEIDRNASEMVRQLNEISSTEVKDSEDVEKLKKKLGDTGLANAITNGWLSAGIEHAISDGKEQWFKGGHEDSDKILGMTDVITISEGDGIVPVKFAVPSDDEANGLMEEINYPVWVLNKGLASNISNASGGIGIDALADLLEQAQKNGDFSKVLPYFCDSGYTVFGNNDADPYDPKTGLYKVSDAAVGKGDTSDAGGVNLIGTDIVIPASGDWISRHTYRRIPGTVNKKTGEKSPDTFDIDCHEDCQNGDDGHSVKSGCGIKAGPELYWYMSIRVVDLNKATVRKLTGFGGDSENRYIQATANDGKTKIVLLMEYPVDTVGNIKATTDGFEAETKSGELAINVLTKKIRYQKNVVGSTGSAGINWGSSGEVLYDTKSVIAGSADHVVEGDLKNRYGFFPKTDGELSEPPHFILTDYLELSYLPEVVDGSKIVALGRRIRLDRLSGSTGDTVGHFIDKAGNAISPTGDTIGSGVATQIDIRINDFVDYNELNANGKVYELGSTEVRASTGQNTSVSSTGKLDELPRGIKTEICPVAAFVKNPNGGYKSCNNVDSISIGSTASGEDEASLPLMYGLMVDCEPFSTGLYSGWIASNDAEHGCLSWWQSWLETAGFKYHIDTSILEQALIGTYSSELRKNGVIVLDLETISHIQADYTKQDNVARVTGFRTAFSLLGIALGVYAVVLLAAWAIDINTVGGPKLLTLMTFGKWVAISGDEDIPRTAGDNEVYMGFSKLIWSVIGLIALGAVINMVDIIEVVRWLTLAVGSIANKVTSVVFRK